MDSLYLVLGEGTKDLVHHLVDRSGFTVERAELFVALAGSDLIESIQWHGRDRRGVRLAEPGNVRDLLSVIPAKRLASMLGMRQADVWAALRTFVPRFLQMADRAQAHVC